MIGTRLVLSFFLLASLALAQARASAPPQQPPPPAAHPPATTPAAPKPGTAAAPAPAKAVLPTTPVITIKGLCPAPAPARKTTAPRKPPAACQTVVTRADLETVVQAVRPNLPPAQRLPLAQQYAQLLVVADAARKAGMEKDKDVQEELKLSRMQILANSYTRRLQKQAADVTPAEIQNYYKANPGQFEQAKLLRIYVPKSSTEDGKPAEEAVSKALADKIRERAAAGEDFEKLQKEAYAQSNNKGTPPSVDMGDRRRGTLPPNHESNVFDLKPGEISPVYAEPSGFYIYKLISKSALPLEQAKDEIKNAVSREKFREGMDKLRDSVNITFNDSYFQPPAPPRPPAPPAGQALPNAPSAPPATAPAQPQAPEPPKAQPPPPAPPK